MRKHTNKFGLLIVDDEPKWGAIYKEWLKDHYILKGIWDSIKECEDADSALKYIKEYKETNDYHLLVVVDAYMPPNCDGSKVLDPNKLFGGLYLIDEVNKDDSLKGFVTVLLITYYDDTLKPYINGDIPEFKLKAGKDYFLLKNLLQRAKA